MAKLSPSTPVQKLLAQRADTEKQLTAVQRKLQQERLVCRALEDEEKGINSLLKGIDKYLAYMSGAAEAPQLPDPE